jgi:thiol-disulfide isomerase/thioredoxin
MSILGFAVLLITAFSASTFAAVGEGEGEQHQPVATSVAPDSGNKAKALKQARQLVFEQKKIGAAFELLSDSFPAQVNQTLHATKILESIAGILETAQTSDETALALEVLSYAQSLINQSMNDQQLAGHGQVEMAYPFMQAISRVAHSAVKFDDSVAAEMLVNVGKIARNLELNPVFPTQAKPGIAANIVAEAKGFALSGNINQAIESMRLAYQWGFVDFDIALNDEVLCAVDTNGTLKHMALQARDSYKATVRTQVQNALLNFPQYQLNFRLESTETGKLLKSEDYRGKIVVLDLGASWCAPCVKSIPHLKQLQDEFKKKGVEVLNASFENGETLEENRELLKSFAEKHQLNYEIGLGTEELKSSITGFKQFPSLVFIDRNGNARFVANGYHDYTQISTIVEILLEIEVGQG